MKLIAQYLTEQQLKKLQEITDETGTKRAELIRRAIDKFLEK